MLTFPCPLKKLLILSFQQTQNLLNTLHEQVSQFFKFTREMFYVEIVQAPPDSQQRTDCLETVLDPCLHPPIPPHPPLSDNHQFLNMSLSPAKEKWEAKKIFNKSQNFWGVGYNIQDLQSYFCKFQIFKVPMICLIRECCKIDSSRKTKGLPKTSSRRILPNRQNCEIVFFGPAPFNILNRHTDLIIYYPS